MKPESRSQEQEGVPPTIACISAVTLATHDMARAVRFYRALSADGKQWVMYLDALHMNNFSNDLEGYADWVRASKAHGDILRDIITQYNRRNRRQEEASAAESHPTDARTAG